MKKKYLSTYFVISMLALSGCHKENFVNSPEAIYVGQTYEDYISTNIARSYLPSRGQIKTLVIPISFCETEEFIYGMDAAIKREINLAFFSTNTEICQSVKYFYETTSQNKITINGSVSSVYESEESITNYFSDEAATIELVNNATEWYFSHNDDDRQNYDLNHDGYLDAISFIYLAPDYKSWKRKDNSTEDRSNLWAYVNESGLTPNLSIPVLGSFLWASYDFIYDKNTPRYGEFGYGDPADKLFDTHTYIHEFGHLFGLDDYYDYSNSYTPAGGFIVGDQNVGAIDPYSEFSLGWAKAIIPTDNTIINLKPYQDSHELILLTPAWNEYNSPFDEYLLLEFYTATGFNEMDVNHNYLNKGISGSYRSGIRLWHVDSRLVTFDGSDIITTNALRGGVHLLNSNSYGENEYISILGLDYQYYNLLQLIRNDKKATYTSSKFFQASDLFAQGDSFRMEDYQNQFYNIGKLNSGSVLPFSFEINNLNEDECQITIHKI